MGSGVQGGVNTAVDGQSKGVIFCGDSTLQQVIGGVQRGLVEGEYTAVVDPHLSKWMGEVVEGGFTVVVGYSERIIL